ncbi:MAG: Dabb family protein [Pseudomonadota bacterium]
MIKHIVMWNVRGDTREEKDRGASFIKERFESLRGRISGMRLLEVGVDTSHVGYACDVVLYTEFDDAHALRAYADHPAHAEVRRAIGDLRTERHQVDYVPDAGLSDVPPQRHAGLSKANP